MSGFIATLLMALRRALSSPYGVGSQIQSKYIKKIRHTFYYCYYSWQSLVLYAHQISDKQISARRYSL